MQYDHVRKMESEGVLKDGYKFLAYLEKHKLVLIKKETPTATKTTTCWCDDDGRPCTNCQNKKLFIGQRQDDD